MPIISMTGFAREAGSTGPYRWAWELKTVNSKGLDIRLRTPPGFDALGEAARKLIGGALRRGTCHVGLSLAREAGTSRVRINRQLMQDVLDSVDQLRSDITLAPLSLDGLLSIRGIVEVSEDEDPGLADQLAGDLLPALERALAALIAARRSEGTALENILSAQLARIADLTALADGHPSRTQEAVRARLAQQVENLIGTHSALDPARLHQEALIIATKADIREELDRLVAHVAAVQALLREDGAIGRKLDFLAQELGREANTLCAKSGDISLTAIGLDLKAVVEQFREQVQNVE